MILAVGNTKGGVGKTTLAVNLAVARALAGRDLLLVDGDEQGTALTFTELRTDRLGEAGYTAVALTGAALRSQVRQLCGMPSLNAVRMRSVSASFLGLTGTERSAIFAWAGVRPPLCWLHGPQAMTTLSQLVRPPCALGIT